MSITHAHIPLLYSMFFFFFNRKESRGVVWLGFWVIPPPLFLVFLFYPPPWFGKLSFRKVRVPGASACEIVRACGWKNEAPVPVGCPQAPSTPVPCVSYTLVSFFWQRWNLMYQKHSYLSPPQIPITHPTLEMTLSTRGPWRGSGLPAWRWWRGTWWRRRGVCRAIDFHTSGRWLGEESVGPPSLVLPQWPCHWGVACTQAC